jgi:hypothetical protein
MKMFDVHDQLSKSMVVGDAGFLAFTRHLCCARFDVSDRKDFRNQVSIYVNRHLVWTPVGVASY